jgi:hypothetical protein
MKLKASLLLSILFLMTSFTCNANAAIVSVTCNGTTSDTATLNNAISGSAVGSEIQIHGTCLINGIIVLEGDRSYIGDSRTGTTIRQAANTNLAAMLASDSWNSNSGTTGDPIRIADMTLDGNSGSGNSAGTVGLMLRSWLTVVDDIQVENTSSDGIQITNQSKNGTSLTNTQVNSRINNVFIHDVSGNGINVVDTGNSVTDTDVLDSWLGGIGQSGINLQNAAGWKIRGNHLYGIGENAIYANRCFGTAIEGNYIEDFGNVGGSSTYYAIACTLQGGVASAVISNNKLNQFNSESSSSTYIFIDTTVNYSPGIVSVVGNDIYGANGSTETGLSYNGTSDVLSSNNVQHVHTARSVGTGVTLVTGQ